jgi:hypothetical protein
MTDRPTDGAHTRIPDEDEPVPSSEPAEDYPEPADEKAEAWQKAADSADEVVEPEE